MNNQKAVTLTACCYKGIGADGMITIAEPVNTSTCGHRAIARTFKSQYFRNGIANFICNNGYDATAIAEYVGGSNEKQ